MSLSKLFIYGILTILIAFGIGYSRGTHPEIWRKVTGHQSGHITILLGEEDALPMDVIQNFERTTGSTVEIKFANSPKIFYTEYKNVDLIFAPLDWLGDLSEDLTDFPQFNIFSQSIASDFLSLQLLPGKFLPLLWRTKEIEKPKETHLQVWGFATTKAPQGFSPEALALIRHLTEEPKNLKEWSKTIGFSFCLELTNKMPNFPDEKRAQALRNFNLTSLQVDRKL